MCQEEGARQGRMRKERERESESESERQTHREGCGGRGETELKEERKCRGARGWSREVNQLG